MPSGADLGVNLTELDRILSSAREFDSLVVKALKGSDGVSEDMMILLFSSNEQNIFRIIFKKTLIWPKRADFFQ